MKQVTSMSRLTNQLEKMFRALNTDMFGGAGTAPTGTANHNYRYQCPRCGAIARSGKPIKLICGDCLVQMV